MSVVHLFVFVYIVIGAYRWRWKLKLGEIKYGGGVQVGVVYQVPKCRVFQVLLIHIDCTYWRRKWQSTPVFLPGESPGWRSLVGYSPWGCKESDTTERLHLNGLVVFATIFNFSLNLGIRSSWSDPQSAPGLVFVDCKELLYLWLQII